MPSQQLETQMQAITTMARRDDRDAEIVASFLDRFERLSRAGLDPVSSEQHRGDGDLVFGLHAFLPTQPTAE